MARATASRQSTVARCASVAILAAVAAAPSGLAAARAVADLVQAAGDVERFDAVVIRTNTAPGGPRFLRPQPGGRVEVRGLTLNDLIRFAYGAQRYQVAAQIVDGPGWIDQQRFDVAAVGSGDFMQSDPGSSGPPQVLLTMVRAMLEDRFALRARTETRDLEIYRLVRAEPDALGPQLKPRSTCRPPQPGVAPDPSQTCGVVTSTPGALTGRAIPIDQLALILASSPAVGAIVRNETGLAGLYDLELTWTPEFVVEVQGGPPVPNPNAGSGPTLFAALEQQLGLKLEPARGPVDVVVVEHAELP